MRGEAGQGDYADGARVHSVVAGSVVAGARFEATYVLLLSVAQSRSSAHATMPTMTTTSQAAPRSAALCREGHISGGGTSTGGRRSGTHLGGMMLLGGTRMKRR